MQVPSEEVETSDFETAVIALQTLNCSEPRAKNQVVDVEESMWALDEDWDGSTDATRSLMLSLARPAPTAEEVTWKKGKEKAFDLFVTWACLVCVQTAIVACNCKLILA